MKTLILVCFGLTLWLLIALSLLKLFCSWMAWLF